MNTIKNWDDTRRSLTTVNFETTCSVSIVAHIFSLSFVLKPLECVSGRNSSRVCCIYTVNSVKCFKLNRVYIT